MRIRHHRLGLRLGFPFSICSLKRDSFTKCFKVDVLALVIRDSNKSNSNLLTKFKLNFR